jgi:hypothetical protein
MADPLPHLTSALSDRYRIERELGAGGMATVYLAEDLRHDRKVALKVLKPELAAVLGAERFVVEIKTTAALQHPHILPLFDSGTAGGFLYYVMPFIDGETLRSKLDRETQLGIDEALRIATNVADALDYAHRHGVIHRDIKPENILLHDGRPMVADFGIALAVSAAAGGRMTETGLSLGTPHYMSPEQATAEKELTGRSDIYSLGSVLYEMLSGSPPHVGSSAQQIIMKIVTEEAAPVTKLRKTVPPNVAAAVAKALEKLPADRFATAAQFADALANPGFDAGGVMVRQPPAAGGRTRTSRIVAAAAWFAVGASAVVLGVRQLRPTEPVGSAERQQVTYSGLAGSPAVSADGRFVAYLETRCPDPPARGGCVVLEVLEVGSARPIQIITGADRLSSPRWTHDGLALVVAGALAAGRSGLFSVPRLGGLPRRLADEPVAFDTHPSADTVALVAPGDTGMTLRVINLASGQPAGVDLPVPIEPLDLSWSPNGRLLAMSSSDRVHVVRREDGALLSSLDRTLTRAPLRWSADGRHILAFQWTAGQDDDLLAFPVTEAGRVGRPRLLVSLLSTLLRSRFDVARGTGRVVIGSGSVFYDVWSFDLAPAGGGAQRLTQGTNWHGAPFLTADGRALYYLRADPLGNSLYRIVDGREAAVTAERQVVNNTGRLSRDERTVTFESRLDSTLVLMIHDVASGTSRWVPRTGDDDLGWLLPGGDAILWLGPATRALWITDANGKNRREIAATLPADQATTFAQWASVRFEYGVWFLAPDGASVAILGGTRDVATLVRVPLGGGTIMTLGQFPLRDGDVGLAGWSQDGVIHLARRRTDQSRTSLLGLDAATGALRPEAELAAACDVFSVSFAAAGRRAACVVQERRADVVLIDGLRP